MSTVLVSDGENWNFVQFKKLRAGSLTTHQTAATTIPVRVHNLDSLPWKWKGQLRSDKPKKQLACLKRYSYVLKLICRHSLEKTNILDNIQVYFISNFFFIPVQSGNLHTPKTWGCHKKYNFLKNSQISCLFTSFFRLAGTSCFLGFYFFLISVYFNPVLLCWGGGCEPAPMGASGPPAVPEYVLRPSHQWAQVLLPQGGNLIKFIFASCIGFLYWNLITVQCTSMCLCWVSQ